MTSPEDERESVSSPPNWVAVAIFSVLVPPVVFVVLAFIQLATIYDPTLVWDITDAQANAALIALSGFVAGVLVALVALMKGLSLLIPGFAGLVGGVIAYVGFAGFDLSGSYSPDGLALTVIGLAVSASVFLSIRLTGSALVGSIAAIAALGVGGGALVASIGEPPAELVLILQNYEDDESGEGCSGYVEDHSGEFTEVVEGNYLYLHEIPTAPGETDSVVGEVALGQGQLSPNGCLFELGDPLGLPAQDYSDIEIGTESRLWPVGKGFEGNRIVIRVEN